LWELLRGVDGGMSGGQIDVVRALLVNWSAEKPSGWTYENVIIMASYENTEDLSVLELVVPVIYPRFSHPDCSFLDRAIAAKRYDVIDRFCQLTDIVPYQFCAVFFMYATEGNLEVVEVLLRNGIHMIPGGLGHEELLRSLCFDLNLPMLLRLEKAFGVGIELMMAQERKREIRFLERGAYNLEVSYPLADFHEYLVRSLRK
jgi:hypothetical protein